MPLNKEILLYHNLFHPWQNHTEPSTIEKTSGPQPTSQKTKLRNPQINWWVGVRCRFFPFSVILQKKRLKISASVFSGHVFNPIPLLSFAVFRSNFSACFTEGNVISHRRLSEDTELQTFGGLPLSLIGLFVIYRRYLSWQKTADIINGWRKKRRLVVKIELQPLEMHRSFGKWHLSLSCDVSWWLWRAFRASGLYWDHKRILQRKQGFPLICILSKYTCLYNIWHTNIYDKCSMCVCAVNHL